MNKKFTVGQKVVCTWGSNKGKGFEIVEILKNDDSYSCISSEENDGKYYRFTDTTLELAK